MIQEMRWALPSEAVQITVSKSSACEVDPRSARDRWMEKGGWQIL